MKENVEINITYLEADKWMCYTRLYPSLDEFIADHQQMFDLCYGVGKWSVK